MPKVTINVITTPEEQSTVVDALKRALAKEDQSKPISVSTIAKYAGISANRVRYIIDDLVESNVIERTPIKAYNEHYVRYRYAIVKTGAVDREIS